MQNVSDIFLRGRAAQHSVAQLAAYNTAFMGNAAIQAMRISLNAPLAFWSAVGRAELSAEGLVEVPMPKAAPKPKAAAKPKVAAKPKAAAAPKVVEAPKVSAAPKPVEAAPAPVAAKPKAKAAAKPKVVAAEPAPAPASKPKAKAAPKPKAAVVKPAPEPAPEPAPTAQSFVLDAPRGGKADPLVELKGVGAKLADALNEFGVYHFDQIAALTPDQIDWLEERQKGFRMIQGRYDLIEQAKARL